MPNILPSIRDNVNGTVLVRTPSGAVADESFVLTRVRYFNNLTSPTLDITANNSTTSRIGDLCYNMFGSQGGGWALCNGELLLKAEFPEFTTLVEHFFGWNNASLFASGYSGCPYIHADGIHVVVPSLLDGEFLRCWGGNSAALADYSKANLQASGWGRRQDQLIKNHYHGINGSTVFGGTSPTGNYLIGDTSPPIYIVAIGATDGTPDGGVETRPLNMGYPLYIKVY